MNRAGLWATDPPHAYQSVAAALSSATPALLFGLRLWAAVCLALYITFWLQLDSPSVAGTTAAVVCQPSLGASLRKGWFRMLGTPTGGVAIVVLTACFPQDRTMFLISLALWAAACTFASTLLQNYAAYAAALSGYTALIIASDQLGATGGLNGEAFTLAITRVTEIGIGIVSAGLVVAGTDLGRRLLALTLRDLRRLTRGPIPRTANEWQGRVYSRLSVLPEQAEPLQRAQLLAALSVGTEIIRLRRIAHRFDRDVELDAALDAVAKGNGSAAAKRLAFLDQRLAVLSGRGARVRLRARGSILAMSEALDHHAAYFDSGAG
jgi:hypothetical protein